MNRKYRKRKLPKYFFIISFTLFLFIGVGYSLIYSNLNLQGNVTVSKNNWEIKFQNPVFDEDSISSPTPTITNGTNMSMNITLSNPGDKYAFTVDLVNNSSLPALIKTLSITSLTEEQSNYLRWKVTYDDDTELEVNDLIKAKETKKVHIYLEYKKLRAIDLYPTSNVNLTLNISINFYLPEESYNTVTLTKNGSTKKIKVSNLEQSVTLTDFPVESTDQVIACNNGVEPSTDTNAKIVLSNVKQDATCRIETSLANAVTNSGTEVTNMAILQDTTTNSSATISSNQNINIDINGKDYRFDCNNLDDSSFKNYGILSFKDKKGTGQLVSLDYRLLESFAGSTTYVNSGTYKRILSGGAKGCVFNFGGTNYIKNSTLNCDYSLVISANKSNTIINIYNSTITGNRGITLEGENSLVNIYNSTITAYYNTISNFNEFTPKGKVYICKSIIRKTNDYDLKVADTEYFYYDSTTLFTNNTNNPATDNPSHTLVTDIACAE